MINKDFYSIQKQNIFCKSKNICFLFFFIFLLIYPWLTAGSEQSVLRFYDNYMFLLLVPFLLHFILDKLSGEEWISYFFLVGSALVSQIISGEGLSGSIVSIASVMLLLHYVKHGSFSFYLPTRLKIEILLFLFVVYFLLLFFTMGHTADERYFLYNGDPNYTAVLMLTPLLMLLTYKLSIYKYVILIIMIIAILQLTVSRMAILAIAIFLILYFTSRNNNNKLFRFIAIFIVLMGVFSQFLFYLYMDDIFNLFEFSATESRLLQFADNSNAARLFAFNDAFSFVLPKVEFLISGTSHYLDLNKNASLIPHHWFMLMWVQYGLMFTTLILILILRILYIAPSNIVFILTSLMVMASILGPFVLKSPLMLVGLIALIFENNSFKIAGKK